MKHTHSESSHTGRTSHVTVMLYSQRAGVANSTDDGLRGCEFIGCQQKKKKRKRSRRAYLPAC